MALVKYNNMKFARIIVAFCSVAFLATSCKKLIDVETQTVVEEKNMYANIYDADAAIIGLYGDFLQLAESHVVLNELRADLMTVTDNADENLREIENHNAKEGNPYIDPKPYYKVIVNCNDILAHFDQMLMKKILNKTEYDMRYADVASIRSWVYLQLGIQFGHIPYITKDIADVAALREITASASFQPVSFDVLLDSLIDVQENLSDLMPYPVGTSLITTVDGYNTQKFFINRQVLLGQLYLWRGKADDFHKAAVVYKAVMETGGTNDYYTYRITGASKADNNDLAVGYIRYQEQNEYSLIDNNSQGWRSIFARADDALFNREWIWYLPYNELFKPENPFLKLFSSTLGSYLLKPSQAAIDNWNAQVQTNEFPYDARGSKFSYNMINGRPEIMKYQYNIQTQKWFLYRAASLNLDFAEAANRDGHHKVASALLNQGLQKAYENKLVEEGAPYEFDPRRILNPNIAGDWQLNAGLRGRANLKAVAIDADSTLSLEESITNERGLELAFEGERWSDLLRIARRRNDPSYLAEKVYQKLLKENNGHAAEVRTKLMNKENWYLPFKW